MISIKVKGEYLELSEAGFRFEFENPLFAEKIGPDYSYPGTFQLTPRNRRILEWPDVLEAVNFTQQHECEVYLAGNFFFAGTLNLYPVKGAQVDYNINRTGPMLATLAKEKLRDLPLLTLDYDYQTGPTDFHTHMVQRTQPGGVKDWVCFPVWNPGLLKNEDQLAYDTGTYPRHNNFPDSYWKYQNYWWAEGKFYYEKYSHLSGTMDYAVTPFPYVKFVLDKIFTEAGFEAPGGSFLSNSEILDLVVYSNRIILLTAEHGNNNGTLINIGMDPVKVDLAQFLPDMTIGDFLHTLRKTFSLLYYFDMRTKSPQIMPKKEWINNAGIVDLTAYASPPEEIVAESELQGFNPKYTYAEDKLYETRLQQIGDYEELAPVATVASLPNAASSLWKSVALVLDENKYYICEWAGTGYAWEEYTYNMVHPDILDGIEGREMGVDTLLETQQNDFVEETMDVHQLEWILPETNSPGTSKEFYAATNNLAPIGRLPDLGENNKAMRLLFYRGMQLYHDYGSLPQVDAQYPYGAGHHFRTDGLGADYTYSLSLKGPNGLYEQWQKAELELLQSLKRRVTFRLRLPHSYLLDLERLWKNRIRIDSQLYWLHNLSVRTRRNGLEVVAELLQV